MLRTADLTYLHFEAFEVDPGEPVWLELGTLPPPARGAERLALGLVLAAAAASAWLLTRPLRERGVPLAEAEESAALGASRREREAVYEAIRDLDHDHETGKVTAEDHARLRDELRARAAVLLVGERRRAAPGVAPADPRSACPACAAAVEPAHRFCPQCGSALRPPGAAA